MSVPAWRILCALTQSIAPPLLRRAARVRASPGIAAHQELPMAPRLVRPCWRLLLCILLSALTTALPAEAAPGSRQRLNPTSATNATNPASAVKALAPDHPLGPHDLATQLFALQRHVWSGLDEPLASAAQFDDVLALWPASPGQQAVLKAWKSFALGTPPSEDPDDNTPGASWTAFEVAQWQLARLASAQRRGDGQDVPLTLARIKAVIAPSCRERLDHPSCDAWSLWQLYHIGAQWHASQHQWASALSDWMEAQRIASDLGQTRLQGMAMAYLASAHASMGHADQALAILEGAQRIVAGDAFMKARVAILASWAYRSLARTTAQREALQSALQAAQANHWPYVAALAANQLADYEIHHGQPQAALDHARTAARLMPAGAPHYIQRSVHHNLAICHIALGQHELAKAELAHVARFKPLRDDLPLRLQELRELDEFWGKAGKTQEALEAFHAERQLALQGAEEYEQDTLRQLMVQREVELQEEQLRLARQADQVRQEALEHSAQIRRMVWSLGLSLFGLSLLTAALALWSRRRRQQLKQRRAQLEHLSGHDALTGLWNRARFQQCVQTEGESGWPGLWLLIDIDHFKQVNDRLGHGAGDDVIRRFANVLRGVLPPQARCVRWGGEEFLVHWPGEHGAQAALVQGQLLEAIRQAAWPPGLAHVTASIGAVRWPAQAPDLPSGRQPAGGAMALWEEAVHAADMALYGAKRHGRDQAWFWNNWRMGLQWGELPSVTDSGQAGQAGHSWPRHAQVLQIIDAQTPPTPIRPQ